MSTSLYLRDPAGVLQTVYTGYIRLEYARAENKTGWMYAEFDPNTIDTTLFKLDGRLEPWRQVGANAPYLDGESVFFIRRTGFKVDSTGAELFRVYAEDANTLLDGRIVAYASKSAQAEQTDYADDLCKVIVGQNLGSTATDTARSLASYLTIQAEASLAPSITVAFAWRNVAAVLQDICAMSFQAGTYLVYDVIYTSATTLEFRTYTGQRGINHGKTSAQPVVISRERRNLEQPEWYEDHEAEKTYIYAGGQGVEASRVIKTATNATTSGASPFNRRELFIDARNTSTDAAIQTEANAALQDNRLRRVLTGNLLDTEGCVDGVDYRYGDIVYAEYRGQGFDAHINALHVVITAGVETRTNQIRGEA